MLALNSNIKLSRRQPPLADRRIRLGNHVPERSRWLWWPAALVGGFAIWPGLSVAFERRGALAPNSPSSPHSSTTQTLQHHGAVHDRRHTPEAFRFSFHAW